MNIVAVQLSHIGSLVALNREAAKAAFAEFLSDKVLTANSIELVNMVVDHLPHPGVMDPALV